MLLQEGPLTKHCFPKTGRQFNKIRVQIFREWLSNKSVKSTRQFREATRDMINEFKSQINKCIKLVMPFTQLFWNGKLRRFLNSKHNKTDLHRSQLAVQSTDRKQKIQSIRRPLHKSHYFNTSLQTSCLDLYTKVK